MIAIIDYGAGNVKSVQNALNYLGCDCTVTSSANDILSASHVILPGVGSFGDSMENIRERGLFDVIHEVINRGTPFLGVCLGLQLLFDTSEESPGAQGLGIFRGRCEKIPAKPGLKIPHMGWNSLKIYSACPLFRGLPEDPYVYFVHSYYIVPEDKSIVSATTEYGSKLDIAVWRDNVFAVQFHPEKSSDVGLTMLKNFVSLKKGGVRECTQNA